MRFNRAIVLIAVTALLAWGLGATSESVKIGVVDLDQAVTSGDTGKAAREEFERKVREAEGELTPLRETFQEKVKELEAKSFILSEDAMVQKRLDLRDLQNKIENKQKEMQDQLEVDRERLLAPLRTRLVEVIDEVGKEGGYSLIFLRSTPGIMYSKEALDVTDLVVEKINKKG
jgi:outer membrane protein